jgi:DNA-binding response OmpR family regulator
MPPTIVIVDDDEQILMLVDILLRRQGYQVMKCPNAYAALELLETVTPDLLILDYMMPGMNGLELCQKVRVHPDARNTPILMLSAVDTDEFARDSRDAGANANIPKSEMHRRLVNEVLQYVPIAQSKN